MATGSIIALPVYVYRLVSACLSARLSKAFGGFPFGDVIFPSKGKRYEFLKRPKATPLHTTPYRVHTKNGALSAPSEETCFRRKQPANIWVTQEWLNNVNKSAHVYQAHKQIVCSRELNIHNFRSYRLLYVCEMRKRRPHYRSSRLPVANVYQISLICMKALAANRIFMRAFNIKKACLSLRV